jgi:hypothetical protein
MKINKVYDQVKEILVDRSECRDSDKKLLWTYWKRTGLITDQGTISYDSYLNATSSETITRSRRKIQELHPELRSSKQVQKEKDEKEKTKGTFIFREQVAMWRK